MQPIHLLMLMSLVGGDGSVIDVNRPMAPPAWALAERAVLDANAKAAQQFAQKFLDERGYLKCVEHWGGNDGPDDAMENFANWTLLYALGAHEDVLHLYRKAWSSLTTTSWESTRTWWSKTTKIALCESCPKRHWCTN